MKRVIFGILLLLSATMHASVTNEVLPADVSSRIYPSDYGAFILTVVDIQMTPKWDGHSDPPLSLSGVIDAVKKQLPPITEGNWMLDTITIKNFDGKGWYYIVVFENYSRFTKEQTHYIVTKKHIAAVLMDGRVIAPSEEAE